MDNGKNRDYWKRKGMGKDRNRGGLGGGWGCEPSLSLPGGPGGGPRILERKKTRRKQIVQLFYSL